MLRTSAALMLAAFAAGGALARTTILVPLDKEPSWRDMAFLAAIPASERASTGGASLIGLDKATGFGPEFQDYARRYRPQSVILLGSEDGEWRASLAATGARLQEAPAKSARDAAFALSRRFWSSSKSVVLCSEDDYAKCLVAASIAGLLGAPLLFVSGQGQDAALQAELRRLGASRLVSFAGAAPQFRGSVKTLDTAAAAMAWARQEGFKIDYVAAVNPLDRSQFVTRKLSLIGAQLAVGRKGVVAPLPYQVEWKRAFRSEPVKGALPKGVPASRVPARSGVLEIGAEKIPFILTADTPEHGLRLSLDRGTGSFSPPVVSGDVLSIDGRQWSLSLGKRTKFGGTDVHLTWPTVREIKSGLDSFYRALGAAPEHLCLVGFPDALPHAVFGRGGVVEEQASDLPYAMVGDEEFARIGVGRVIAEGVSYGTLYAARALTYRELLDSSWSGRASQAEWENSLGPLFENVGFANPFHMQDEDVPWLVAPAGGKPGRRAPSFGQDSPLASSAVLAHSEHSSWQGLGKMFGWDASVILAPVLVESGGCGTACLDREADNRSVVARMLRLGAVGFSGGSRELSAESQPLRMEFWNGILAGQTIGQAHRRAQNAGLSIIADRREGPGGAYRYSTNVRMQFGDPALAISLPGRPKTAPARTAVRGNLVTVFAPARWSVVQVMVPPDWKQWAGKDLFSVRGPGATALSSWSGEGRDREVMVVCAEFRTERKVASIVQVQDPGAPLGWSGRWQSFSNPDGSYTHRFLVRMIDFDQEKGRIIRQVDQLQYRLEFGE